jgi:catechol 2,3-dioxygenase-like lactoylglutathione lyase family enzyme
MLTDIHPKLPMRRKDITKDFYINVLSFHEYGYAENSAYLMVAKDNIQIHFFEHIALNPLENDGQVYIRTDDIDALYDEFVQKGITLHPSGHLAVKPWGTKEFSILDPDNNLLTFGQIL